MKTSRRNFPAGRVALLHFSDVALTGGEQMILRLLRGLAGGPLSPILITQARTPLSTGAAESGVEVIIVKSSNRLTTREGSTLHYPWWRKLQLLLTLVAYNIRLIRTFRQAHIAVLWCSNIRSFLTALVAAKVLRVPIIWNIWGERRFGWATRIVYNLCFRAADLVVTEYFGQAGSLFSPTLLTAHQAHVKAVYTGIDDAFFTYESNLGAGRDHHRETIVACSRICEAKGLDDLVSALALLKMRGRRVTLRLVGAALTASDRAFQTRLLERVEDLQLCAQVELCGWQNDVKPFLADADLLVSASLSEGLPGVVREAQAMGKAVVATDVGGTREAIAHGQTGTLVRPGDPAALADALQELLGRPDVLQSMSAAARLRSQRLFSLNTYLINYSHILSGLLQSK
jgi:glycosyltransferase involved in cell wall biosynthesis